MSKGTVLRSGELARACSCISLRAASYSLNFRRACSVSSRQLTLSSCEAVHVQKSSPRTRTQSKELAAHSEAMGGGMIGRGQKGFEWQRAPWLGVDEYDAAVARLTYQSWPRLGPPGILALYILRTRDRSLLVPAAVRCRTVAVKHGHIVAGATICVNTNKGDTVRGALALR
jgi:hypothetical protein